MTLLDLLGLSITLTFIVGIVWLVARAMFHKPTKPELYEHVDGEGR